MFMSFLRKHERYGIATAASLVAMLATMPSSSYAAEAQASQALDEVIVTGSRIVRDGYEAPTPLTVVDATALQSAATANMADQLRTMPVFAGNLTPAQGAGGPSSYQGGLNLLNLRNMGAARTLILLDGQRNVGARTDGVVDVNNIPQQLISRVDIVTGGASAVYGSDAPVS
jgi:iron complex outermembrane receptor protein